jgi:transposase
MSLAFIFGCNTYLPNASITFDKFHVAKEVNKAMDELRKLERKCNAKLIGQKYILLKSRLTPKLKEERYLLLEYYPKLGESFKLEKNFLMTFGILKINKKLRGI